ncbi:MAG: homocysteine S-methyltransferase family protein [Chloroflexota bacterium]|nr:homocysteine S-methyltransferase family protein [Chloroflexota bacterium]MDP6757861.1 homocysteine S-methyltransferase family protein [Chloroflexota bacterium]
MTTADIRDRLQHGLLFDGAMGTMLGAADDKTWKVPEELNLNDPDRVRGVHRAYAEAGADVIATNTFGGNRIRLERAGFADRVEEFNVAAALLAREASGDDVLVAGDIGPSGEFMEPLGERSREEFVAAFTEQAAALAAGGCDLLLIETMSDLGETGVAIEAALTTGLPVIATMSFDTAGRTMMGVSPADAAIQLAEMGVIAVGANCGMGPDEMTPVLEQMHEAAPDTPVLGQSNAGMPRIDGEHVHYDCTPAEMAAHAEAWLAAGIQLIGSCCGSTPEHVGALRAVLDRHQAANS